MKENRITPTQRLWRLLKPDADEVRSIHIYSIFRGLISLTLPLGIQSIVNLIQGGQINTSWMVLVAFVVLGIIATGILQVLQLRISENLQQKIFTRAALEFTYRIPQIRKEALYKHYAPELMNRFFDIASVQKGLSKVLIDFSAALFIVFFSLLLLSFYHPFFIMFSVALLILIYVIFRYTADKGMMTSLEESKFKYQLAHWLEELSRTAISFKLAGKTTLPLEKTDEHVVSYLAAREDHFKILVRQYSLMVIFKVLITIGLLAIGGILVMNQQMNIGQFIAAEIIVMIVMTSVEKLVLSAESIYDILTSLEKIGQVTDLELDRQDGIELQCLTDDKGVEIELQEVSFVYPGRPRRELNDISFRLNKGELIMITGENGSGKSTLLHVVSGLYAMQDGALLYNGFPVGNITLNSIREQIGNHMTTERLFEGTIADNISLGRKMAPFENVKWAADNLELGEFIRKLPEGYNTMLNTQGKGLPASVIAKLLLARGIAAKPKLLLLENTLEHLDDRSCKRIIDFLTAKENGWSILAVSANGRMARAANRIIVMKKGSISTIGTYDELKDTEIFKFNDNA